MSSALKALVVLASLGVNALAATFPPTPENLTIVNSTKFAGASISWKATHICETTEGTRSYAGYVHLSPESAFGRRSYPVNAFFWFFGARNDPDNAPFSLWFQGGPGVPSISAALGENGPCRVSIDSRTTSLNPWSWNERVNMLYIDQPVTVGFSYESLANGTINEIKSPFQVTLSSDEVVPTNQTTLNGTFSSNDPTQAPNTSDMAAEDIWEVMQVFLESFEPYTPDDNKLSLWGESYGGHYVPTFAAKFQEQNALIENASIDALTVDLDTVGLVNACVDMETQIPFYPEMAYNNTYGIEAITEKQYQAAADAWPQCKNLTRTCRSMAEEMDPQGYGNNTDVNDACYYAYDWCYSKIQYPFEWSGLYHFDILDHVPTAFPPKLAAAYLNQADIQRALGVPLNFTGLSGVIATTFNVSVDFVKGRNLAHLGQLLNNGVKIALMYGDRDYQCNWLGGEALSLAIDSEVKDPFNDAGYADIQVNSLYVGGKVRQHGNLSFSRVFEAGHEVPWYQPETAYQIFNRVMFNENVASGEQTTSDNYSSSGPASVRDVTNEVVPGHERYCYLWDMLETCLPEEYVMVMSGAAIIKDYILVGYTAPNGTNVYLLNGTTVGEQMMSGVVSGENGTGSGTGTNGSAPQQTTTASGNAAMMVWSDKVMFWGVFGSLIVAVVSQSCFL